MTSFKHLSHFKCTLKNHNKRVTMKISPKIEVTGIKAAFKVGNIDDSSCENEVIEPQYSVRFVSLFFPKCGKGTPFLTMDHFSNL